jgi:hypothetical protein
MKTSTRQLNALKKKFAHRDPTAAVYAGRVALGFLFDHGDSKRCAAKSAAHEWIGDFGNREQARRAITAHHLELCTDASCACGSGASG